MGESIPPSAEEVAKWQAEEAKRRAEKKAKDRRKGYKSEETGEVLTYTVVGGRGQADSNSGYPKGRVNVGSVPTVPR